MQAMVSTRQRRERRERQYTGVLRDRRLPAVAETVTVQHSEERPSGFSWRLVSFALVLLLSLVLVFFYVSESFYVRSISVAQPKYLTKEEIFAFADIANLHIFWVSPQQVRANLLRSPSIADARVWLSWPPHMVNIVVEEREPSLVWEQGGTAVWLDVQGRMMAQRQDRPDLLRVIADATVQDSPLGEAARVDPQVVIGALQLRDLLPSVTMLRYESVRGLGFVDTNGWTVWLGTGANMREKVQIYQTIAQSIAARGIQAGEINVSNPDAPYYTVMWGR